MTTGPTRITHISSTDVLAELERILLYQADQLAATANASIAEAFIGFERDRDHSFGAFPTERVDLQRFPISRLFHDAVLFITQPHSGYIMGEEVHKLRTFMFHSPRSGPHSAVSRLQQKFMRPWGLCRTVSDAAIARWKLEVDRRGDFSLRELALLADVSDKAAESSLSRSRQKRDLRAYVSSYTTIEREEAVSWLSEQPGFVQSWDVSKDRTQSDSMLSEVRSTEDLRNFVRLHRLKVPTNLRKAPDDSRSAELERWERGGFIFEPTQAADFARSLCLDVPLFVGKVLEVSLRMKNVKR